MLVLALLAGWRCALWVAGGVGVDDAAAGVFGLPRLLVSRFVFSLRLLLLLLLLSVAVSVAAVVVVVVAVLFFCRHGSPACSRLLWVFWIIAKVPLAFEAVTQQQQP